MRAAVYNSGIPNAISNLVASALRASRSFRAIVFFCVLPALAITARATDWSGPELQLARKIVAVTGPGAAALTIENRSSLGKRDQEIIQNGLRSALEGVGIRFVKPEQSAATITISLSENSLSYIWVAEIRQGGSEAAVVMTSAPRAQSTVAPHESVPLSLRKTSLWTQDEPILDVAVLEENTVPSHMAVLDSEKISLYRLQGGKWMQEQALDIVHARPWPRDLRGRLIPAKDHLLDAYLPGVICRSSGGTPLTLNCRETDDPWPLVPPALSAGTFAAFPSPRSTAVTIPSMGAFYAPTRNFFTGVLTPGIGKFKTVSKFYSAALLPREKYMLWLFATTDGHVHMVDGINDQVTKSDWGSDLTSVRTPCGAGWQVLATSIGTAGGDSVRAFEFPDRDPVAVSTPVDFAGNITALWTEAKGDTAIAIAKSRETESYEAFRLAISCNQ